MLRIEPVAELTPAERAAIIAPLDAFSRDRGFVWQTQPFALALRNESATILGGLIGELHWGWLHISILAVDEGLRGQGWGRKLMEEAERLAVAVGCRHAWLDTYSFQARPFYEKLGYHVFGELPDYPVGQTRYFLTKALPGEGAREA
jgi:ribosomal protein S18 acetylase RimI-like enzyme